MSEAKLIWHERPSNSEFVASVWTCKATAKTSRTVLADACISLALVNDGDKKRVIVRGPGIRPYEESLACGYECTTIRLRPGVQLQGISTQEFMDSSLVLPADSEGWFLFEDAKLYFPDFNNAELLIDQLCELGYLKELVEEKRTVSTRTHSRIVKRTTGLSPYQLWQLQRVHQALRLLKQGMSVTDVVVELNFVDQAHLTRVSRQFLGHTPKQLLHLPQIP